MLQVLRSRAPNPAPKLRAPSPAGAARALRVQMCMHMHSWSPQALLSARRAPPVLVRVNASGGRAGGSATDALDGQTDRQRPAVRVPAARVLRSGDGEVRYTEYGYTYYGRTVAILTMAVLLLYLLWLY